MPRPSLRTRSRKRRSAKLPGGRTTIHYKKEKAGFARCGRCGRQLSGIPRLDPSRIRKLPQSRRRVERIYGGYLCHECLQEMLKEAVRGLTA